MGFSFEVTESGFTADKDRVRFHINDTDPAAVKYSDELIKGMIAEQGSWQKAVITLLYDLWLKLSNPDFKADWLEVSNQKAAADSLKGLIAQKCKELGVSKGFVGSFVNVYRADSLLTSPPTYATPTEESID